VRHAILLLVLLTLPTAAAPRLKDRKPIPDPEEARIAALKAKYAAVRASGDPVEGPKLDLAKVRLQIIQLLLEDLARHQVAPAARQERVRELEAEIRADPILKDLYDIAVYDRRQAGGGK
jgi:hypothetical protein